MVGLLLSAILAVGGIAAAQADPLPSQHSSALTGVPAAVPLSDDARIKAWQDLRFGLFIHWGVYSNFGGYYKGVKQWKGYPEQIKAWGIDANKPGIPDEDYLKAASEMTIPHFNAQQWCQQAKDAGMKYLLVTSKHHDGFAMWDTATTHYDFYEKAPGRRDPMKELADACNGMGIKLAFYFSIIDWTKQTPEPYKNRNTLDPEMMTLIHDQLKELLSGKYGQVPELWFDMGNPTAEQSAQLAQWVREFSPNTLVNSRVWNDKGDFEVGGDNTLNHRLTLSPWEAVRSTFPNCWGYCTWPEEQSIRNSADGVAAQTKHEVENLFTTIANGGQYLLNVGPRGTGEFDPFEVKILEGITRWNARHPKVIHGAVPTYYPKQNWGYSVINGNAIYLGVTDWPTEGTLRLPGAGTNVASVSIDDATAAAPQTLRYSVDNNDLVITIPTEALDAALPVIKVETTGAPIYAPANATALVKGKMENVARNAQTTVNSPKGGAAQVIIYAKNETEENLPAAISVRSSYAPATLIKVTAGTTSTVVTAAELSDGVTGFTVPAHTIQRFVLEPAHKHYYADALGGGRGRISRITIGAVDTARPQATIEHRFITEDGSALPPEVMAHLPKSRPAIAGLPEASPSAVTETTVRMADGQWTFLGWDHESLPVTGDTVAFTGTWKYGPLTYPVSYTFENATPDHEAPFQLEYFVPRTKEYPRGTTVHPPTPPSTTFRDRQAQKTWRFLGWNTPSIENLHGPVEIVGRWGYDRDSDVSVRYTFTSQDGTPLPPEVNELLPEAKTFPAPVEKIIPSELEKMQVTLPSGVWTFKGWDGGRVGWPAGPTHTYTGIWEFMRNTYTVTYSYRSAQPTKEMPEAVTKTLPAEVSAPHGAEIMLPLPRPARIEDAEGAWVFSGWEPSAIASLSAPTQVSGTWTYLPKQRFTSVFTFESAHANVPLPANILSLLPDAQQYAQGDTVVAPTPATTTLSSPAGTWTFQGWTPEKVENAKDHVAFVGKWSLDPTMHTVTYVFTSSGDKALPDEVNALLPAAQKLAYGTKPAPASPATTSFATIEGEWHFDGWNLSTTTVTDDVTVSGAWTYTAREFSVKLSLPAALPDAVRTMHDPAATPIIREGKVCAPPPVKNEVAISGGTWRFEGWEKECYTQAEIAAHLSATAEPSGSGAGNGAALFALKNLRLVYSLPFTPVWKFSKKAGGQTARPGGLGAGGSGAGSAGAGSTGAGTAGPNAGAPASPEGQAGPQGGSQAGRQAGEGSQVALATPGVPAGVEQSGMKHLSARPRLPMTGADGGLLFAASISFAVGASLVLLKRRRS